VRPREYNLCSVPKSEVSYQTPTCDACTALQVQENAHSKSVQQLEDARRAALSPEARIAEDDRNRLFSMIVIGGLINRDVL